MLRRRGEAAKIVIRNVRRDTNDLIKKQAKGNEISEDEETNIEDEIQKMTDKYIEKNR